MFENGGRNGFRFRSIALMRVLCISACVVSTLSRRNRKRTVVEAFDDDEEQQFRLDVTNFDDEREDINLLKELRANRSAVDALIHRAGERMTSRIMQTGGKYATPEGRALLEKGERATENGIQAGMRVRFHGLKRFKRYNFRTGKVIEVTNDGRVRVRVDSFRAQQIKAVNQHSRNKDYINSYYANNNLQVLCVEPEKLERLVGERLGKPNSIQNSLGEDFSKLTAYEIKKQEVANTTKAFTLLLASIARDGRVNAAMEVFNTMQSRSFRPTVYAYNTLLTACERASQWEQAQEQFELMTANEIHPLDSTYNILIKSLSSPRIAGREAWKKAWAYFKQMLVKSLRVSTVTFSAIISGLANHREWRRALSMFDSMDSKTIERDVIVFSDAIRACAKGAAWSRAEALIFQMKSENIEPSYLTYRALLDVLGRGQQWERALRIFEGINSTDKGNSKEEMSLASLAAGDSRIYGMVAYSLTHCNRWADASQLVKDMHLHNLPLDNLCLAAAIESESSLHDWSRALEYYDRAREQDDPPTARTYDFAISAAVGIGDWKRAIEIFHQMIESARLFRSNLRLNERRPLNSTWSSKTRSLMGFYRNQTCSIFERMARVSLKLEHNKTIPQTWAELSCAHAEAFLVEKGGPELYSLLSTLSPKFVKWLQHEREVGSRLSFENLRQILYEGVDILESPKIRISAKTSNNVFPKRFLENLWSSGEKEIEIEVSKINKNFLMPIKQISPRIHSILEKDGFYSRNHRLVLTPAQRECLINANERIETWGLARRETHGYNKQNLFSGIRTLSTVLNRLHRRLYQSDSGINRENADMLMGSIREMAQHAMVSTENGCIYWPAIPHALVSAYKSLESSRHGRLNDGAVNVQRLLRHWYGDVRRDVSSLGRIQSPSDPKGNSVEISQAKVQNSIIPKKSAQRNIHSRSGQKGPKSLSLTRLERLRKLLASQAVELKVDDKM